MYKLIRNCCECGKELKYSCKDAYNLAVKANSKCRSCATRIYAKRAGDCSFLLQEDYESLYWLGFIMSDGHIDKSRRLVVTLANEDKEHLAKLAIKLGCSCKINKHGQVTLAIMHTHVINKLCEKYNIQSDKTYNPCNISTLTSDKLLALAIGFIDGDGCIKYQSGRTDVILSIKCHSSWLSNLLLMFNKGYIDKRTGYAITNIGKLVKLKEIKKFAVDNNLPILTRKWDKITL